MRATTCVLLGFVVALFCALGSARAYDPGDSIVYRRDLHPGAFGTKDFSAPMGGAIDDLGYVYVADTSAHRIVAFNPNGTYMESFGGEGSAPGKFYYPHGISVGDLPNGGRGLYVVDGGNHRVQVFTDDGRWLRAFGSFGGGKGQLNTPAGIATMRGLPGSGVWVADTRNGRIVQFTTSGRWVKAIDCQSCAHGPFVVPVGIALRRLGDSYRIYVSEEAANRVRVLTPEGREIDVIGKLGPGDGELGSPDDIAVDEDGSLFVAEAGIGNERISVFGPNGKFIRHFGHFGTILLDPFIQPHGVAVGPKGRLLVLDTGQGAVHTFEVREPAVVLVDAAVSIRATAKAAYLAIYQDDVERKCNVGVEATFTIRKGAKRVSFTKTGVVEGLGATLRNLRLDLTAEQAGYFVSYSAAAVRTIFRGKCGRTALYSTGRADIER